MGSITQKYIKNGEEKRRRRTRRGKPKEIQGENQIQGKNQIQGENQIQGGVPNQGDEDKNKKNQNCKSDIFKVNYKVKIPGSKQHILVEPKMLDKSISGLQTKVFYLSCLTQFKEDSLNKQPNEKAKNSFFNAIKGTRRSGVPSNIIKIMSNREYVKNIVNWLIKANDDDTEVDNLYNKLYKFIGDNQKKSADFQEIRAKIITELNSLDDIIKDLTYSFRKVDNVRIFLIKIKKIIQSAERPVKELKQVKNLLKQTEDLLKESNDLLTEIKSTSRDNFEHNSRVALKALFQKGNSFYFAGKEYFIKSILKTSPPSNAKRSADSTTIYASLTLVESKEQTKDYGKLDCNEKKKQLSALFNDVYGSTLGRVKYTYDTSRYYASKIGNQIYKDAQILNKRNRKERERQRDKRKEKILINMFENNILGNNILGKNILGNKKSVEKSFSGGNKTRKRCRCCARATRRRR